MAAEDDGRYLVAQHLVGQVVRGVVDRGHQDAEQVLGRVGVRAARLDDVVDDGVEVRERPPVAAIARRRDPLREVRRGVREVEPLGDGAGRVGELPASVLDVEPEQRPRHDGERGPLELLVQRDRPAGRPAVRAFAGLRDHRVRVLLEPFEEERRLESLALLLPVPPLAEQEAVADDVAELRPLERPLPVAVLVGDEHALDLLGVGDHHEPAAGDVGRHHVAVRLRPPLVRRERVADERERAPHHGEAGHPVGTRASA